MAEIKRIPIDEFQKRGYLQELNRRFLHPLGMALEVAVADDGTVTLGGIWDYRDDPEGIYFDTSEAKLNGRAAAVAEEWASKEAPRRAALGYMVQPAGLAPEDFDG